MRSLICCHSLHRGARVHTRPSVTAANMGTRGDAALTHAASEGWMSERLELSVSSCGELHIKNAPFEENKHTEGYLSVLREGIIRGTSSSPFIFLFLYEDQRWHKLECD